MVEQTPVDKPEPKPETPQNTPKAAPAPAGVTSLGRGPSSFPLGGGYGDGQGGGSRWGWYASGVQNAVRQALLANPTTHHAGFSIRARIWSDLTGRILRVQFPSTGNAVLDEAIRQQINEMVLPEPPPAGMPMPINLQIDARH